MKSKILLGMFLLASSLFSEEIHIKIPKVPTPPEVKAVVPVLIIEDENSVKTEPKAQNKKRCKACCMPQTKPLPRTKAPLPHALQKPKPKKVLVGDVSNRRIAAYLEREALNRAALKVAISKAGMRIVAIEKLNPEGTLFSYVVTNPALISIASQTNRGFCATLRITLDTKNNLLSITNPKYMLRAFLQDNYNPQVADAILADLREGFGSLHNASERVKFSRLPNFVFMKGMPGYMQMVTLARGSNLRLLNKARASKRVLFEQKLKNGSILLGIALLTPTRGFIDKTGHKHAAMLPYPVLIENNEAKTLDPKYYIAVMYPALKMSQFMQIADVPAAIERELGTIFR